MIATINSQLNEITNSLRAFSLKLTGNDVDANDLYQDTAYRIMSNADKFRAGTNFKAWAVTIMRNIFINNYRKKVRRGTILDETPNNYYINSGGRTIQNDGESNAGYKELLKMVAKLPEEFKRPFWMAYKGYKYDEIAEELDAPLGTIKSRIFFARRKLRDMYEAANAIRA
jgi:RNA polymerase sigma-70 factor (ECF subfamily)